MKLTCNKKEINLENKIVSKDTISFKFTDNEKEGNLILFRNELGTIYQRNGERNDLCVKLNGWSKIVRKLIINESSIKMIFSNGKT